MDLLDRVDQKSRNKNSPDRMGLFQPQRGKAATLLLAWLSASLRSSRSTYIAAISLHGLYADTWPDFVEVRFGGWLTDLEWRVRLQFPFVGRGVSRRETWAR